MLGRRLQYVEPLSTQFVLSLFASGVVRKQVPTHRGERAKQKCKLESHPREIAFREQISFPSFEHPRSYLSRRVPLGLVWFGCVLHTDLLSPAVKTDVWGNLFGTLNVLQ